MRKDKFDIEHHRDLSNHEGIVYEFFTERGKQALSYAEYLADIDLRAMVNNVDRYRLILGRVIFSYSMKYLAQKPNVRQMLTDFEEEQRKNPLRFFAPSGNQMLGYINDFESTLCVLTAANRVGKTQSMMIKKLINNIPCDPSWEIFTKYGVKYRPFRGERNLAFATYDLAFHRDTTIPMLLSWIPESELGPYAKSYKGKGAKQVNVNNVPILPLMCGTKIYFTAMSQGQAPYEGNVKHDWGWDEQGSEAAFIGADARIVSVANGRHDFALTPHKIDGRPDTGAGSWINKVCGGEDTYGHDVGLYQGQVWDVPDWIFPEKAKTKEFEKWVVEPARTMNDKRRREGLARFFGKWHEASGLVIDEWDSTKHVIEPFDIPKHWPKYRGVDHGTKHPAAALCCAVSPAGDLFVYQDWLKTGLVASKIAQEVIEWSGNTRKKIGAYRNPKTDGMYDRYQEVQNGSKFEWTVLDSRAFSKKSDESGMTLGKLYELSGLKTKKASGQPCEVYVPILKEWFFVDKDKKHFVTGEAGAPRIYVFSTCTELIKTIKRWVWAERKTKSSARLDKESPIKTDDDLMDVLKYIIQANPRFKGSMQLGDSKYYDGLDEFNDEPRRVYRPVDPVTGY